MDSNDHTFGMWSPTIILQVIQCMSIVTTCMPTLKPFLDSLESGQMNANDSHATKSKSYGSRSDYQYHSGAGSGNRGGNSKAQLSNATHGSNGRHPRKIRDIRDKDAALEKQMGTLASATAAYNHSDASWDESDPASQTVLIHQTWRVDVESKSTSEVSTDIP